MASNLKLSSFLPQVLDEMAVKSRKAIYQRDFEAWQWDILGERNYEHMRNIQHEVLFGKRNRSMVKSANGSSKTFSAARWATWWVTAFPPEESLAIMTAPTLGQVQRGVFAYMKRMYGYVKDAALKDESPMPWPGWINDSAQSPEWNFRPHPGANADILAFGKVPAASDAVSTFQGVRKEGGRTFIVLDEAGGVSTEIFTAIEALITGDESRMVGIGNPDKRGTEFHRKFTVKEEMAEHHLMSISAFQLPSMTGEIVYPDDPRKQEMMMKGLTSRRWIAHKSRVWATGGEIVPDNDHPDDERYNMRVGDIKWDARGLAKVMGEFPGETDNSFFPQEAIDIAFDVEIDEPEVPLELGVDIARYGEDESVVMVNMGGKVRLFSETIPYYGPNGEELGVTGGLWSKESTITTARRVDAIARYLGVAVVKLDGAGIGGAVFDDLDDEIYFPNKPYEIVGFNGGTKSADKNRWALLRDQQHDNLRTMMVDGRVDLDPDDTELRDQLLLITYGFTQRGGIKITPKDQMKGDMGGSPDRLDAVIYAVSDVSMIVDDPNNGMKPGDRTYLSASEFVDEGVYSDYWGC